MKRRWITNILVAAGRLAGACLNVLAARFSDRRLNDDASRSTRLCCGLRARRDPRRPVRLLFAVALAGMLVAGCNTVELYANLDEQQANEIVATLHKNGIHAQRHARKQNVYSVTVADSRFAEAVHVLRENGLPRQNFATLGDVFKKDGLISSPVQERAQMIFALSQELSHTVSDIDGVLSARVHLVLPENDPLRQQLLPSSASVFIRHHAAAQVNNLVPQIKMLVANGVAGLAYDKVSVILVPVEKQDKTEASNTGYSSFLGLWLHHDSLEPAAWLFSVLIGVILVLGGALGAIVWRQRRQVYPLKNTLLADQP